MKNKSLKNRGLKNRVSFSNAIDKILYEKFDLLAQETRIPKSRLLDEAIELLLKKYDK
ncbi:ribbon-helix-helix protein [Alkalibaculum bacchi]|uniref:Ribbon-helix-helix protein n=1 Tax=Alkalibaculum bacchi TaxID=645887 RepID=A0A366HXV9_9FIRM|nr:ribbon-helix-helix domain-containing protein [Alkalibaculum bacchi]RBP57160.1 ribbon-helix-helix protein [Alkalibaculum bacchi]